MCLNVVRLLRSYTYPLLPTPKQAETLFDWIKHCRWLYNACLEQRTHAYTTQKKAISRFDQTIELTELRKDLEWGAISVDVLRSAITRLDRAFLAFFRRVKQGDVPGYPRYKGARRYASFTFPKTRIVKNRIKIPTLGYVKFNLYRKIPAHAKIKQVSVKYKSTGNWAISLVLELGPSPNKNNTGTAIGIDVGLTHFATLSNGEHIPNPRFYRESEAKLKRLNQELARKQKDSNNRFRAKVQLAKAYERIKNLKLNHARHLAKELVTKYDLIAFEALNIKGMVRNHCLSKAINDVAWSAFIICTTNKAEEAGKWVQAVNPSGTSIDCYGCGKPVPKDLSVRVHDCPQCGLTLDRDHNAALNILARGLRVLEALKFKVVEGEALKNFRAKPIKHKRVAEATHDMQADAQ
jgi:putative transposase